MAFDKLIRGESRAEPDDSLRKRAGWAGGCDAVATALMTAVAVDRCGCADRRRHRGHDPAGAARRDARVRRHRCWPRGSTISRAFRCGSSWSSASSPRSPGSSTMLRRRRARRRPARASSRSSAPSSAPSRACSPALGLAVHAARGRRHRRVHRAARPLRAGKVGVATWIGLLVGTAVKVAIVFAMVGAFIVALLFS